MASKQHNFIVSFIAGKLQKLHFKIIYLDGNYVDCLMQKPEIPPQIINHRPDIIAEDSNGAFCIGEAKTSNDLHSKRTKEQLLDFTNLISINPNNKLIIGIPSDSIEILRNLFVRLGILNHPQIEVFSVPTLLMSDINDNEEV
jgi:hypothetical protein